MSKPPSEPPANKSFRETLGIAISLIDKSLKGESPPPDPRLIEILELLISRVEKLEHQNQELQNNVTFLLSQYYTK